MARVLVVVSVAAVLLTDVASAVKLSQDGDDDCTCLNWKELYASKYLTCHNAPGYEYNTEFMQANWTAKYADEVDDEGRCTNYLEKYDGNFCLLQQLENPKNVNKWCYVSSKCKNLNGGSTPLAREGSDEVIGVKFCDATDPDIKSLASTAAEFKALLSKWGITADGADMNVPKFTMIGSQFSQYFVKNCDPSPDASFYSKCYGNEDGGCKCLNWKELYASKFVSCHNAPGYEYYTEQHSDLKYSSKKADEVNEEGRCTNYLEKYDGNFCIVQELESTTNENMWCYVSAECKKVHGGGYYRPDPNSTDVIGMKICDNAAPKIPATTIQDYQALCKKWGIDAVNGASKLAQFTLPANDFAKLK